MNPLFALVSCNRFFNFSSDMEGDILSFSANRKNGTKNGFIKKKKGKFSVLLVNGSPKNPLLIKKKKLSKCTNICENSNHDTAKFLQYTNTKNYVEVIAKPESLPPPPEIFQTHQPTSNLTGSSDHFLLKFLSEKTCNTDVSARFENFSYHITNSVNKNEDRMEKKRCCESAEKKVERTIKQQKKSVRQETPAAASEKSRSFREEDVEVSNLVNLYTVIQSKALIFHMSHPSKFSFHGEIKATILMGEIEILGYSFSHHSFRNSVNIYSPNFCTPLIVETKANSKPNQSNEQIQTRLKDFLTEDDCNTLLSKLSPDDSLLLVEPVISDFGIVLNKYFDRALFPKDLEDVSSMTETMESLQSIFTFKLSKDGKYFKKNPQWDKIPLGHCTVLCGGKGVGKSMLLKYYVNKLLAVGEKVLVLDLDPGQPEFTFPGCISAVIVEEPVIGPNFTHIIDPVRMTCFGDVDVTKNPAKYLECVSYIINSCKESEELLKMKWLVNTMGFCKGLGVDLIITTLKLLNPNTVVQIKSSDFKNNYPFYLTPATLNARTGFRSMAFEDVNLLYDLRVVSSSAEHEKKQLQGGLKRKELRDIMSISYFSKMVSPPFYNFNAVQPYLISFSKVYLGVDFLVDPNDVLKAFNGNTVSLSNFEPDGEEILSVASGENDYFQIVVKPRVVPCLGIGFIRGVDCAGKKFYLLTHLTMDVLNRVNCLSLGRVSPPHCMFLRQEAVESRTVYTTTCTVDIIKSVKRMFRVPGTPLGKERF